jgi:serine/threonine protein kinase
MRYKRESGFLVTLSGDKHIGRGTEGEIWTIKEDPNVVAKIYKPGIKDLLEKKQKLMAMIKNPPNGLIYDGSHYCVIWPLDLLFEEKNGDFVGYIMPKLDNKLVNIWEVSTPSQRIQNHRCFDYEKLYQAAINLFETAGKLHSSSYIIGDISIHNIFIDDESARITLVDADSFQVTAKNIIYNCPVGNLEYSPPEILKGGSFNTLRSIEHDLFGLAVIVYQLLMENHHPFSGCSEQEEDLTTKKAIINGYFVNSNSQKQVPIKPNPQALKFQYLDPELRILFSLCFDWGHKDPKQRPSIGEWLTALKTSKNNLKICSINSQHKYSWHINECPWCIINNTQEYDPFPPRKELASLTGLNTISVLERLKTASNSKSENHPLQKKLTGEWDEIISGLNELKSVHNSTLRQSFQTHKYSVVRSTPKEKTQKNIQFSQSPKSPIVSNTATKSKHKYFDLEAILALLIVIIPISLWGVAVYRFQQTQSKALDTPKVQFQKSCGDSNLTGLQTFYPVFVNRTENSILHYIKKSYCGDAFIVTRKDKKIKSIQVASFLSKGKASEFAKIMIKDPKINRGEVGSPTRN